MITEGYTIIRVNGANILEAKLLAYSIKKNDPTRPIAAIVDDLDIDSIQYVDHIVQISKNVAPSNDVQYFYHVVESPFDRSICLAPNQLLTKFNPEIWENLRGLGPVVLLKNKITFAYEKFNDDLHWKSNKEKKAFGYCSNLNIAYYDRTLGSDDICGLATTIISKYNNSEYTSWQLEQKKEKSPIFTVDDFQLPTFPEFLWSEWVMSFVSTVTHDKVKKLNFVNNIDLTIQDNNVESLEWSKKTWETFLNYWVTDTGEVKIENFIQHGLISYGTPAWLSPRIINNIYGNSAR